MLKSTSIVVLALALIAPLANAQRNPELPEPYATVSTQKVSKVIGWPAGRTPIAATGFRVALFSSLPSPRSLYVLPSGNVLVSQSMKKPDDQGESSPDQITLYKIKGPNSHTRSTFLRNIKLPFGMAVWNDRFFVAEPEKVWSFPYANERITGPGKVIATLPFPEPKRHWTRHLLLKPDGTKLYVAVGSASNVGESPDPLDPKTAAILEMNLDGTEQRIYAGGLRNPVSMAWEPLTGGLWAVVNERDELGDDLPPDYITKVMEKGFYGWPYAYWGQNEDPRLRGRRPDLVQMSLKPDFAVGAHTASLGITFTNGTRIPAPFNSGALVTQHGSWNRAAFSGYKVLYVPFINGVPQDEVRDFLTGFIASDAKGTVYGRPVATAILKDGSVLVTDDGAGKIWRVRSKTRK